MSKPKYSEVESWIKNEIYRGNFREGEKIPSETTLMQQFGYSRQTIRLALRNLEELGFLQSVRGSGTFVKMERLNTKHDKKVIGVILTDLEHPDKMEMLNGIEKVLTENGYTISLGVSHNRHDGEYEALQSLVESEVDGFIIEGAKTAIVNPNHELFLKIKAKFPCVFLNSGNVVLRDIPSVACDDIQAGYIATKYLIERGHRDIATISHMDSHASHKRYVGYIRALHESGIPFEDSNMMWCLYENMGELFDKLIEQLMLKNLYKCTAVMCHNDTIVKRLMSFLETTSLKPFDDISIISFENSEYADRNRLTGVDYDRGKIGEEAAKLCIKMMNNNESGDVLIPPSIVARDSVRVLTRENRWSEE